MSITEWWQVTVDELGGGRLRVVPGLEIALTAEMNGRRFVADRFLAKADPGLVVEQLKEWLAVAEGRTPTGEDPKS